MITLIASPDDAFPVDILDSIIPIGVMIAGYLLYQTLSTLTFIETLIFLRIFTIISIGFFLYCLYQFSLRQEERKQSEPVKTFLAPLTFDDLERILKSQKKNEESINELKEMLEKDEEASISSEKTEKSEEFAELVKEIPTPK